MKLKALCDAADIFCPSEVGSVEIESIVTNSKNACRNSLFVCIRGTRTDGHQYAKQAVANGCCVVLTEEGSEHNAPQSVTVLTSKNTRCAAAMLYHAWYGFPANALRIIGVTGTNGKTTVTHMLRAILEATGARCGLIGTVGCESNGIKIESDADDPLANMTTPDPAVLYRLLAEMVRDGVQYVVMEVSSHALALEKVAPIFFEMGIFTNLTAEHLDFHQTMDAYRDAKAKLFAKSRVSVLNADSDGFQQMAKAAGGKVVRCSQSTTADAFVTEFQYTEKGVEYHLNINEHHLLIQCPILGEFTLMNSMQAATAALCLNAAPRAVQEALAHFAGVVGRMERVTPEKADFEVLIDYAHTPDALLRLLKSAQRIKDPAGRVVVLFGCGGDRDQSKRQEMGKIASAYADYVIVTSDNSRGEDVQTIISQICKGMDCSCPCAVIPNRKEAIRFAVWNSKPYDLILLAGKGHEQYEITRDEKRPFSEKEIVLECFNERLKQSRQCYAKESDL